MTSWFVFNKSRLLLQELSDGEYAIPQAVNAPIPPSENISPIQVSAATESKHCVMAFPVDVPAPEGYTFYDLRQSYFVLAEADYQMAGKCHELVYWDQRTRYCGHCGTPQTIRDGLYKECPSCHQQSWPQLTTAIIVLISRGDDVLLVRSRDFRGRYYGLVAGFVETGESLEEAVRREVKEETSLTICNLRYFGSQPWPYPSGLMVGFTAEYADGELQLQASELSEGGWFHYNQLPEIPQKMSIARRLIDHWTEEKKKTISYETD